MSREHYFRVAVKTETGTDWDGMDETLRDELKNRLEDLQASTNMGSAAVIGVHEITAYEYEKLAEADNKKQKLIDREMEKVDMPQEAIEEFRKQ